MINDTLKKKYNAFWEHESIDRCLFYLELKGQSEDEGVSLKKKWEDIPYRINVEERRIQNTKFYADAFPTVFTNFGPGCLAACIGGDYELAEDTIWFDRNPIIYDWNKLPEIRLHPCSDMWRLTENYTTALCESGKGDYFTSIADLGGTMDIIASLRGAQELLYDLYDYPGSIKKLIKWLRPIWTDAYNRLYNVISRYQEGMTSWMPIWCAKRYYPLQSDFSAMMSPEMFDEFVLPDLKWQTEFLDNSIYHLDGPGEIPHLDKLLSLDRLDAIQWVPGAGNYDVVDEVWFEMYQKIQAAGKSLILFTECPDGVEKLVNNISTKGLFIWAKAKDEKHAEELMRMVDLAGVR